MDTYNPHAPLDDSGANTPLEADARSLNGDDDDRELEDMMQMDGAADARVPAAAQELNAEVGEAIVKAKAASRSPVPPIAPATLEAKVEEASEQSEAGADDQEADTMDIDAPPAAAPPAMTSTPPKSPLPPPPATEAPGATGTAPAVSTAGADVEMDEDVAKARDEGVMERNLEDVEAEATTEMRGGGHNVGGGPAV